MQFLKFTFDNKSAFVPNVTFQAGLNKVQDWVPAAKVPGGFHFTTFQNASDHVGGSTHVWTVTIPEDEFRVSFDRSQGKAASIIMTDKRPVADILKPFPLVKQADIYRTHRQLMTQLGVKPTPEMFEASAPTLVVKIGAVSIYSNGLHVTDMPDGSFVGTFTRDADYVGITFRAGSAFTCPEFRNGHAYGAGTYLSSGRTGVFTGTFVHTMFHGPGTMDDEDGTKVNYTWGEPALIVEVKGPNKSGIEPHWEPSSVAPVEIPPKSEIEPVAQ